MAGILNKLMDFIGIEDVDDILWDIDQALARSQR